MPVDLGKVKAWVEELRETAYDPQGVWCAVACDHLEALVAEVEELRREIAQMREDAQDTGYERDLVD